MRILFQGDSITDAGRNREDPHSMGQSYAFDVAGQLGAEDPENYEFLNLAVSGDRVVDVYARIKKDAWNHEPDVFSLLVGVNDVWHELGARNGVDSGRYERVYRMLIEDTLKACPSVRFLLLEPFVLMGRATREAWKTFYGEVTARARIVEKLAGEYGQVFVPLMEKLEKASEDKQTELFLADGVHPTPIGHHLIAEAWLEAFRKNILA